MAKTFLPSVNVAKTFLPSVKTNFYLWIFGWDNFRNDGKICGKKILEKDVWLEGGMGEKIDESWVISPQAYQNTISPNLRDYRNENKEQTPWCFWTKLPQQLQQRSSSHFAFGLFILFFIFFISVSFWSLSFFPFFFFFGAHMFLFSSILVGFFFFFFYFFLENGFGLISCTFF